MKFQDKINKSPTHLYQNHFQQYLCLIQLIPLYFNLVINKNKRQNEDSKN